MSHNSRVAGSWSLLQLKSAAESVVALEIAIEDNGRGFDAATSAGSSPGDGLTNMPKRMAKIGGGFFLASLPGQGTKIRLTVKVNGERQV